ncbi:hypothetical protein EDD11_009873 [Mortierella claussenii]|nr:hypothetical protein EDD11_009873 [Mortierella claussenii]
MAIPRNLTPNNSLFDTLCADYEDITIEDLKGHVSQRLDAPYLQQVADSRSKKVVQGAVWGVSLRPIISLHVQISDAITTLSGTPNPVNVHFLYMATSPQTYMSEEAMRVIGVEDMVVAGEALDDSSTLMRMPLLVNGYQVQVARSPATSHFAHVSILGEDFVHASRARVFFGGDEPTLQFTFP